MINKNLKYISVFLIILLSACGVKDDLLLPPIDSVIGNIAENTENDR